MEKIILAAVSANNVIGYQGKLPWHIPDDMKHFKELTLRHPIIMGRKTAESIGYLENRINLVVTNNQKFKENKKFQICNSIEEAFSQAKMCTDFMESFRQFSRDSEGYKGKVYIIGGEQIYKQTIGLVDRLELTRVHQIYRGDAFFPEINWNQWQKISGKDFPGKEGIPAYSFESYKRI